MAWLTLALVVMSVVAFPYCVPGQLPLHGAKTLGPGQDAVHFNLQVHGGWTGGKPFFIPEWTFGYRHGLARGHETGLRLHSGIFPVGVTFEYSAPANLTRDKQPLLWHFEAGYLLFDFNGVVQMHEASRVGQDAFYNLFIVSPSLITPWGDAYHNTVSGAFFFNDAFWDIAVGDALGHNSGSGHVNELGLNLSLSRQTLNLAL